MQGANLQHAGDGYAAFRPSEFRRWYRRQNMKGNRQSVVNTAGKIILTLAIIGAVGAFISHQLPKTERSY